ncbi:MAG: ABC transporter ATP-binding protein [Anaerolineales bacterium]|nr:ABC transporter ATP-binding protein [Anaerolineales bacterium]MCB0017796.1 ABC transporter ATP-binding protein [Anaerolineales bacterium]MCB8960966.1 ABC transporter ATP-binding protein [Ardenticatenales bacterium]
MIGRQDFLLNTEERKANQIGQTLRRLGSYFRRYWLPLVFVAVFVVSGTYMQVLIPDLQGQAVDCYLQPFAASQFAGGVGDLLSQLPEGSGVAETTGSSNCTYTTVDPNASSEAVIQGLGGLILLIVGLYVGSAVISGIQFFLMSWAGFHALRDLRADVFQHVHRLSLGYFSKHEVGDVMSRFTNDIDTLQQVMGFGLVSVIQGVLLIVWIVYNMLTRSWSFALISLVTLPLMFVATRWFSQQARRAFRVAREEIGSVNADLQESISAVREVQAFSREDENIEQFAVSNAANRDANIRAQVFTSALAPTLEALSYVSLAVVAAVGGYYVLSGQDMFGTTLSLGLIITFIAYTQQFNRPVQQISVLWTNIQSAIAGAERIFSLLDEQPEIEDKANAREMPPIEGHVRFDDVWAEYNPGEPVLKGVSLEATPGQMVAIVGPTGAGKTTIINLLPRFWDVTSGSVTIDGHDVRDVTGRSLRGQMGIVLQDAFLFSDTVMNNIRYGRPEATDAEVVAAAKLARADDFIQKLEQGYETILGERGAGLSQGQRQLLAIARVALTDPNILILDEATSSVDTRTERQIQVALDDLLKGRTSFVIAHRLSTIRNADQVLVLEHGEIIERGTHESLLADKGFYYNLYMSQFRRQLDDEDEPAPGAVALEE